jgi:acyl carrier protein
MSANSPSAQAVRQQLREFITSNFMLGKDASSLKDADSFLDTGIVDSTGVLEIVGYIQETFSVAVPDEDLVPENLDSIDNLTAFVGRLLSA